jgi:hypothetical protein
MAKLGLEDFVILFEEYKRVMGNLPRKLWLHQGFSAFCCAFLYGLFTRPAAGEFPIKSRTIGWLATVADIVGSEKDSGLNFFKFFIDEQVF